MSTRAISSTEPHVHPTAVSLTDGLIGALVILRGMSYIGHDLSHAAFGGAVVGFILNLNFYAGTGAMGLLAVLLINRITRSGTIKLDAAIGIVTNAMFALASPSSGASLLGITEGDLLLIGFVSLSTLTTMFLMYRPLLFSTFDQEAARVLGIRTASVQLIFSLLLTLIIIASMNIIGVTMIAATLITPAATARLMTDCFSRMLIYALIIGGITGVAGMYLSYIFNPASGATIVLFGASLYCLSWLTNFLHDRYILQNHLDGHSIKALNETRLDFKSDLDQCACHRK